MLQQPLYLICKLHGMSTRSQKFKLPPRTAMEVFEMLPEGTLAEVINNVIYMSPAPSFEHQDILGDLFTTMNTYVRENMLGKCLVAPLDVFFDGNNALQPDIVFISNQSMHIVKDGRVKGAPDLLVEVLSPGNKKHDTERKKPIYEKFGVKEYFIVDPKTREVWSFYLKGNQFVKETSVKGKITSRLLKKTFTF